MLFGYVNISYIYIVSYNFIFSSIVNKIQLNIHRHTTTTSIKYSYNGDEQAAHSIVHTQIYTTIFIYIYINKLLSQNKEIISLILCVVVCFERYLNGLEYYWMIWIYCILTYLFFFFSLVLDPTFMLFCTSLYF
jgi:hypothetical protein